jgi:hypothetical protein
MSMKLLGIISVGSVVTDLLPIFLHSADTREKMEVHWDSASAVYRLKERLSLN